MKRVNWFSKDWYYGYFTGLLIACSVRLLLDLLT